MKNLMLFVVCMTTILTLPSCSKNCSVEYTYLGMKPYVVTFSEIKRVTVDAPQSFENYGSTTVYGDYIYVTEPGKGIHVFDNQNPAAPVQTSFIKIPGNEQSIIKDGKMYANGYVDLFVLDVSTPSTPRVLNMVNNFFPGTYELTNDGIVLYELEKMTQKCDCGETPNLISESKDGLKYVRIDQQSDLIQSSDGNIRFEKGSNTQKITQSLMGSTAKYAIVDNGLFIVDKNGLKSFSLSNSLNPTKVSQLDFTGGETVFGMKNRVLVGTNSAVRFYKINSDQSLTYSSMLDHVTSCDPVVANDKYAYATFKTSTTCGGWRSALMVADISNFPREISNLTMTAPGGLGIVGNKLLVTSAKSNVHIFDIQNPEQPVGKVTFQQSDASDIIPLSSDRFLVFGKSSVTQYELIGNEAKLISKL